MGTWQSVVINLCLTSPIPSESPHPSYLDPRGDVLRQSVQQVPDEGGRQGRDLVPVEQLDGVLPRGGLRSDGCAPRLGEEKDKAVRVTVKAAAPVEGGAGKGLRKRTTHRPELWTSM